MDRGLLKIDVTSRASIANLGAGYDCLALAVNLANAFTLYVNLRSLVEGEEKEFEISLAGDYATEDPKLATVNGNLFIQSFRYVVRHLCSQSGHSVPRYPIMIRQKVSIPPMRGLGSSSSACVAGVVAAVHFLNARFPSDKFLSTLENPDLCASLAMHTDSCPDNICACLTGGLTYSFLESSDSLSGAEPECLHFFRQEIDDPDLCIVALVPENTLGTPEARRILRGQKYSCSDAAFNICRSTCLPAVFRDKRYAYLKEVMKDRIHQQQRASEFYKDKDDRDKTMNLDIIFDRVVEAGAYGACISGAGSTLVAFTHSSKVRIVKSAFQRAFEEISRPNWIMNSIKILKPSNTPTRAKILKNPTIVPDVVSVWRNRELPGKHRGPPPIPDPRQGDDDWQWASS